MGRGEMAPLPGRATLHCTEKAPALSQQLSWRDCKAHHPPNCSLRRAEARPRHRGTEGSGGQPRTTDAASQWSHQDSHKGVSVSSESQQKTHSTLKSARFQERLTKDYKKRARENAVTQRDEGRGTDQNPEGTSQRRGQQTRPTQSNPSGKRLGAKCPDLTLPFPSHRPQRLPIGQAQQKAGEQEHV